MISDIENYDKQLLYVIEGLRQRIDGGAIEYPPVFETFSMDKPIHILTANTPEWRAKLIDKGDHYEMMYPRFGSLDKTYKNDFCWINDEDTVFLIERPFRNRLIRFLQTLLPSHNIHTIKNDIMIDGYKIGPTCMAGAITDWNGNNNPPTSSLIYCLRWSNVDKLDEIFKDDPNHQERKANKAPLGSIDMFVEGMTRLEFIKKLEDFGKNN